MVGDGWQNNRIYLHHKLLFCWPMLLFTDFFFSKHQVMDANKTSTSGDLISPFTFLGDQSIKRSGDETPSPKKKGKQFLWQQSSVQFSHVGFDGIFTSN